ncbi:MAG: 3-dehydroquinate dehydratase [Actinomycetota bacterium]|nr:3-dehydroquinate dehydratase [Actinomycetota bacterium]
MRDIIYLFGPNLDRLGTRDPAVYGSATLADLEAGCIDAAARHGLSAEVLQSNREADLVDAVHAAVARNRAIVINPGALTHYSYSLADALAIFSGPKIEVHLSNVFAREPWRQVSVVAPVVNGTIVGLGKIGFMVATEAVAALLKASD